MLRPNTRVQRTRSSASPPHSPLTRNPLGGVGIIGAALIAALSLACRDQVEVSKPPLHAMTRVTPTDPLFPSLVAEVRLERLGCFGMCPIYTFSLRNTGGATYIGERHVERIGSYTGRFWFVEVGSWLATQPNLLDQSEELPRSPDAERVRLTFVMKDGRQIVKSFDSRSPRPDLWGAAKVLEGVAWNITWKKVTQ